MHWLVDEGGDGVIGDCILVDVIVDGGPCFLKEEIFDLSEGYDSDAFLFGLFALVGLLDGLGQSSFEVILYMRALQE